jgi:predicted metalloprotease with PDZ domain
MRFPLTAALFFASAALFAQPPVRLNVDATDATRRLLHVRLSIPAKAGPMTLLYPQWIPGEHGPTGPVVNLVGLTIQGKGKTIPWRRDSVNMYAFHLDVPAGVSALEVAFDYIAPPESEGFSSAASTTSELAVLSWNQLLLYPEGIDEDSAQFQATLRVPDGWRFGTALPIARESGNQIEFRPASLTTLVDSPLSAGAHYRTIDLGTDNGLPHYLHIAADSEHALDVKPEIIDRYKTLVKETGVLFGARHYRSYHFLFSLSDHIAHFGLEHHESSDNRSGERTLIDPDPLRASAYLLPHEFVHSWNGKYRRPAGLTANGKDGGYQTPMKGDLLWVYEGLTNYLGEVLARRSGLWSEDDYREWIALTAAEMDTEAGRRWRPLEDTAVAAQILYSAGDDYNSYRRNVDYYPEGSLIWLEVDTVIRQMSKGARSLDDFCRSFLGGPSGKPELKTYEFADVVAALNAVQPYDWAGFLKQRVRAVEPRAPLGGIERGGWKLAYDGNESELWKSVEGRKKGTNLMYSIGISVKEDGTISDVQFGGPAQKAGISPSTSLIAVNGRAFTPTVLRDAVARTASDSKPLEILIKTGEYYQTHRVEYRGGERYPHLVRDESKPDLLSEIIKAPSK